MSTPKPATPLPWSLDDAILPATEQDAAYIVHAANAYPRLVDALRELIQALDAGTRPMTNQPFSSVSDAISILANIEVHARTSIVPARALLRELGEDA